MCRKIAGQLTIRERAPLRATALVGRALGSLGLALLVTLASPAGADPASPAPAHDEVTVALVQSPPVGARNLDTFLILPAHTTDETAAQRTDASLAEAVARRGGERGGPTTGFRKRSIDLFSHERPVEFGEQEMVLRLRLRAKSRETMSMELRF